MLTQFHQQITPSNLAYCKEIAKGMLLLRPKEIKGITPSLRETEFQQILKYPKDASTIAEIIVPLRKISCEYQVWLY